MRMVYAKYCGAWHVAPYVILLIGALVFLKITVASNLAGAASFDTVEDLSGKAIPLVILKSQDNFTNELRYEVRVKNQTGTPFIAESLIIVFEKVTNIGGFDREALKKEPLIDQIEIIDQDGSTPEGKSYFYIPTGGKQDLPPFSQSLPVTIRIRNPSYVTGLTPSFRIYGTVRPPEKEERSPQAPPKARLSPEQKDDDQFQILLQLLIKNGIVTKEEWNEANSPATPPKPLAPIRTPSPPEPLKPSPEPSLPVPPQTPPIPNQP